MKPKKINNQIVLLLTITFLSIVSSIEKNDDELSLGKRVQQLIDLSLKKSTIRLNGEKFRSLIGSKSMPRNYSFVVMMTALKPFMGCLICREASDEFTIVANSWRYSPQFSPNLFFGVVDYDEGPDVFKQFGLNSAPVFLYFSEKGKIQSPEQIDIGLDTNGYVKRGRIQAEAIARWIADKTDIQILVIRPPNYSRTLALLIIFALIGALLYWRRNNLYFLYNRTYWALASLSIVFAMTSGQMWNHIHGPNNGDSYIHGSSGDQFVIETYIIFILNATITLGMILMIEAMKGKGNFKKRKITAIVGMGLVVIFFSYLISIFRSKFHGYPYSFLFK